MNAHLDQDLGSLDATSKPLALRHVPQIIPEGCLFSNGALHAAVRKNFPSRTLHCNEMVVIHFSVIGNINVVTDPPYMYTRM